MPAKRAIKATPAYKMSDVSKVLQKFRTPKHFMQGGEGVCCYIWLNGQLVSSENCIRLGGLDAALRAVQGVHTVKINLD